MAKSSIGNMAIGVSTAKNAPKKIMEMLATKYRKPDKV